jgi:acyl-CoA reductase-like NAD-dependent aldehyde dehydrogenase
MALSQYQLFINGQWADALDGGRFDSVNPAIAQPWASFAHAQAADVDAAVQAAQNAFENPSWRNLHATARGKLLRKLGDLIAANKDRLAQLETNDNGKLIRETMGQIGYMPEFFYYYAGQADKLEGQTLPLDKADMFAYTTHEPLGVVAAIIPWNSPMYLTREMSTKYSTLKKYQVYANVRFSHELTHVVNKGNVN